MTMTEKKTDRLRTLEKRRGSSPKPEKVEKTARIVVLGEAGVGKTALIVRCLTKRFLPEYIKGRDTSDVFKTQNDEQTAVNLELYDCNNQDQNTIASADGFVLIYSVANRSTMKLLLQKLDMIRNIHGGDIPIAIVANKRDLNHLRNVSTVEGIEFASVNKASFFCELSVAKDYETIPQLFVELFKCIETRRTDVILQRRAIKPKRVNKMMMNIKDMVKRTNNQ